MTDRSTYVQNMIEKDKKKKRDDNDNGEQTLNDIWKWIFIFRQKKIVFRRGLQLGRHDIIFQLKHR